MFKRLFTVIRELDKTKTKYKHECMEQQFKYIDIERLQLDLFHPRLPKSKQGKDENTVIEYMLLETATLELMESIGENGFFAGEMLLVIPRTDKEEHLKELVIWWFKKNEGVSRVLGDSDGMKRLNEVLGNEVALAAFKSGVNIDTAYELTNDIDLQFERKVKKRFGCFREKA